MANTTYRLETRYRKFEARSYFTAAAANAGSARSLNNLFSSVADSRGVAVNHQMRRPNNFSGDELCDGIDRHSAHFALHVTARRLTH